MNVSKLIELATIGFIQLSLRMVAVEGVKEKLIVEVAECLHGRTDDEILQFYIN